MVKKMGESEKIKFWEEKVGEWHQSGLNRREYCKQNELKITRLGYWIRRIDKLKQEESLVEVKIDNSLRETAYNPVEVIVGNGFDHQVFCDVIKALESLA